jgi:ABC-2 type transport system permease protein
MKKTLLVLKNEIITILSRRSFWMTLLGLPLVAGLIYGGVGYLNKNTSVSQAINQALTGPADTPLPEGYVDHSGLIQNVDENVPPGTFIAYSNEAAARTALEAGEIAGYYVVPADYVASGEVTLVKPDVNPMGMDTGQSSLFSWLLRVNLLNGDVQKARLVGGPIDIKETSLAVVATAPDENNPLAMWAPYAVTLLFYMLIIGSASLLLGSIAKEKENRAVEVLLTSVTPRQLLTGKIIGLGIIGLAQTLFWTGTGYLLLNASGRTFNLPSDIHLAPSFLAWGLLFFILGYAVYASLMAGLGALAPNLREASQATFIITLPLIIPMFLSSTLFMQAPNGGFATILSLFPLSAPVAMMARLSAGGVPWWHPWVAALLLAGTALLVVRLVAGMFHAQTLLSGQTFNIKAYFRALIGK